MAQPLLTTEAEAGGLSESLGSTSLGLSENLRSTLSKKVSNTGSTARDHLANERTFLSRFRTGYPYLCDRLFLRIPNWLKPTAMASPDKNSHGPGTGGRVRLAWGVPLGLGLGHLGLGLIFAKFAGVWLRLTPLGLKIHQYDLEQSYQIQ